MPSVSSRGRGRRRSRGALVPRSIRGAIFGGPGAQAETEVVLDWTIGHHYDTLTGVGANTSWRLNSPFDPRGLGGSRSSQQFDQYAAVFRSYMVTECLVTVETSVRELGVVPDTLNLAILCLVSGTGNWAAPTSVDEVSARAEGPLQKLRIVQNNYEHATWKFKVDMAQLFGVETLDQALHGAAVTADPTNVALLQMMYFNNSTDSIRLNFVISMRMKVKFWGLQDLEDA